MKEIVITNKLKYLQEHYPFSPVPNLTDKRQCIQCDKIITVGDYKLYKDEEGEEYICCPNAPGCNGSVLDWKKIF